MATTSKKESEFTPLLSRGDLQALGDCNAGIPKGALAARNTAPQNPPPQHDDRRGIDPYADNMGPKGRYG